MSINSKDQVNINKEETTMSERIGVIEQARKLNMKPQYLYSQIRENKLKAHTCECGHLYLLISEVNEWLDSKKKKTA